MTNPNLIDRIDSIESRLNEHLHDGIGVWKALERVETDIGWIKKAFWVLVTLGLSFNGLLAKYVLSRLPPPNAIVQKLQ